MFVGKIRVKRLLPLIFLCFILLPNFTPLVNITPVLADEAEEEDGFRQMPNYRWRNMSTTSGNIQEELIEDVYRLSSINNPSGSSVLVKSRSLNSRDFYFQSRFALDVGGSTVEIFQDELGDAVDFEEGDVESFVAYSDASISASTIGFLDVSRGVSDSVWGFQRPNMFGLNLYTSVYRYLEFRIKATGTSQYDFKFNWGSNSITLISGDLPTEFTIYRIDLWNYSDWTLSEKVGQNFWVTSTDSSGSYLIDYLRFIGDMDYASFYQGEIEDAWDFYGSDNDEYYDDDFGNVSDFNDGSLEVWDTKFLLSEYPTSSDLELLYHLKYDEQASGTGNTYDSSYYGRNIEETWGNGNFNASSYREQANHSIFVDGTYFDVNDPTNALISENFTVGVWVNLESLPQEEDQALFARRRDMWNIGIRNFSLTSDKPRFYFRTQKEESAFTIYATTNATANEWVFVVGTYDNGTQELKLYINGVKDNNMTGQYGYGVLVDRNGTVGDFYEDINLTIDNSFYFNRTLTPTEIFDLYERMPVFGGVNASLSNYNNWLKAEAYLNISEAHSLVEIFTDFYDSPNIDKDKYQMFDFEIKAVLGDIDYIRVRNASNFVIALYDPVTNIAEGQTQRIILEPLTDWLGTSGNDEFLKFEVKFDVSTSQDVEFHLNYTYLRDIDSSFDDWGNVGGMFLEDNTVNFAIDSTNDFELLTLRNIPSEYFDNVRIRLRGLEDTKYQYKGYTGSSWVNISDMIDITTEWQIIETDLRLVNNWKSVSNQRKLGIQFYDSNGLAISDNSWVNIDYIMLLGHYDEDEGFKFSLYNEDDDEGMYWKFTRIGSGLNELYLVTVDMLDHTGIALHFNETFQYDRYTDGWLRLDVEWHLDKKKVKMELEFENGTNIIKTRSISYIYPVIPTELRLYLMKEGFPQLAMDNSISGFSKSIIWIDFIDADWTLTEWKDDPATTIWTGDDGTNPKWYETGYPYQNSTGAFSSISPYGMTAYQKNSPNLGHYYWLNIDRFDGLKYDLRIQSEGLDQDDYIRFYCDIYQVEHDGYLQRVVQTEWLLVKVSASYWNHIRYCNNKDGGRINAIVTAGSLTSEYLEVSYSFFRESENVLIQQDTYDNGVDSKQMVTTFRHSSRWTQEFVVFFYYYVENSNGGYSNDRISMEVRGFDVQRKDILGGIVAAILSPILFVLSIILTPIILFLQAVMLIMTRLFGILLAGLTPLLNAIVSGLVSLFGPLTDFISSIFEFLLEFGNLIFEILFSLLEEWMEFVTWMYGAIIDELIWPLIDLIIDGLGIRPLVEFILGFIGDMVTVVWELLVILGVWVSTVFGIIGFWIQPDRLATLGFGAGIAILFYVLSPVLTLWQISPEDITFEDLEEAFSTMFGRSLELFGWVWQITTYIFDFVFNVLKTIGNYIPFT